ncbi:hypothetical protein FRC03_006353 [Tulasnella sp. 419]|nr:hypothetical protein FRC03_006353 [Tulasnella sp. 419]
MMVHIDYTASSNGTIVSDSGSLLHIGQMFFEESLNDQVFATSVYAANTNLHTTNDEDSIFAEESADGNNAFVNAELLGSSIEDGIYGYITVGVNSSSCFSITTTNYNTGPVVIAEDSETATSDTTTEVLSSSTISDVITSSAVSDTVTSSVPVSSAASETSSLPLSSTDSTHHPGPHSTMSGGRPEYTALVASHLASSYSSIESNG